MSGYALPLTLIALAGLVGGVSIVREFGIEGVGMCGAVVLFAAGVVTWPLRAKTRSRG